MTLPSLERLRRVGLLGAVDVHLGRWLRRAGAGPEAVLAGALASRAVREGHVCVELSELVGPISTSPEEGLESLRWPDWRPLAEDPCVGDDQGADDEPLVQVGSRLYLARYHDHERALAADLRSFAAKVPVDELLLEEGLDTLFGPDAAAAGQKEACRVAVRQRLAVISGGPGTGKTYTVARLVALLGQQRRRRQLATRVRLLAPTGKAAARLLESLQAQTLPPVYAVELPDRATTIQRALSPVGGSRTRFRHHAGNPLPDDVVVVDEASMVDLALMRRLVDAIRPDAHLVLLGDRHQLVSVESGAVLGEIVRAAEAGRGPIASSVAMLSHSFRFDGEGGIGAVAEAVRRGDVHAAFDALREGGEVRWLPRSSPSLHGPVGEVVEAGYLPLLGADSPRAALDALGRFRVLCAHRRGPWGVEGLNPAIEQLLARRGLQPSATWYERRPIMVTRNDYRQDLFNGDQGVALRRGDGQLRVWMAGEAPRPLAPARLSASGAAGVQTVFALSIHKSQGSEYDHVLVVLPEVGSALLCRELLYTAVTRAKRRLTVVGGEPELAQAIRAPLRRASGLAERLLADVD